jgi:hypothetical protein
MEQVAKLSQEAWVVRRNKIAGRDRYGSESNIRAATTAINDGQCGNQRRRGAASTARPRAFCASLNYMLIPK